jgi:hypothetical protein
MEDRPRQTVAALATVQLDQDAAAVGHWLHALRDAQGIS